MHLRQTTRLITSLLIALFLLTACGGGGNGDDDDPAYMSETIPETTTPLEPDDDEPTDVPETVAPLDPDDTEPDETEADETARIVDEYTCADEIEQAVAFTSLDGTYNTDVPTLWDGTLFIVDVSSTFPNCTRAA